jgi:multidrug resistance efflux pump
MTRIPNTTPTDITHQHGNRSRSRRRIITVGVLLLLAAAGGGAYLHHANQFVSTDNAQVDGQQIQINAPTTGTVVDWDIDQGTRIHTNEIIGRIQILSNGPQKPIKAPGDGTIAVTNALDGTYVTTGTNLATTYDLSGIYITAQIPETSIADVHPGAPVDISADPSPDTPITGVVEEIQNSSQQKFSLFQQNNTNSSNFQTVTEQVPVKIELTNTDGQQLIPGENVNVTIHKHFTAAGPTSKRPGALS